ncbi:hypothetical protein TKK_0013191 [Trichogramma kaykai]
MKKCGLIKDKFFNLAPKDEISKWIENDVNCPLPLKSVDGEKKVAKSKKSNKATSSKEKVSEGPVKCKVAEAKTPADNDAASNEDAQAGPSMPMDTSDKDKKKATTKPVMLLTGENFPGKLCKAPPLLSTKKQAIIEKDVIIGENQPIEAKQELIKLLHKYRETIAMSIKEIGHTGLLEIYIKELPWSKTVNHKP